MYADFTVNGIRAAERAVFFDVRITNADAPSYVAQDWLNNYRNAAQQKHDKTAEDVSGIFTLYILLMESLINNNLVFKKNQ